ncbi:MAG: M14-type cytosolic carboxypeptidase [Pseudomonadota bacterium]
MTKTNSLTISVPADSGNIDVLNADKAEDIRLAIKEDGAAKFYQWFYFRVTGGKETSCRFTIENAGGASYPPGWPGYRVCASYDLDHWFRIDTTYTDGKLAWSHEPETQSIYYAYFAAYPVERYRSFVAEVACSTLADQLPLGSTLDGEPMDLFRIGTPAEGKPNLLVIGRQHPGESMASWWMEGFLPRLLDESDAVARALREEAVTYVVPLVNIDGVRRGHLRTNAAGKDLNREWAEPTQEMSPEIFNILRKMDETGCDFFFDIHGDEEIANNFIAGTEGNPNWSDKHHRWLEGFKDTLAKLSPAFQTVEGYPLDAPGAANLKIAANAVGQRFDCLSMTMEMPFKDTKVQPDDNVGWSPDRCADFGRSCLDAIWMTLPDFSAD